MKTKNPKTNTKWRNYKLNKNMFLIEKKKTDTQAPHNPQYSAQAKSNTCIIQKYKIMSLVLVHCRRCNDNSGSFAPLYTLSRYTKASATHPEPH